jgi:hypothetical protein
MNYPAASFGGWTRGAMNFCFKFACQLTEVFNHMKIIKDRINTTIQNMQKLISGDDTINRINESARIIINALKSGNKRMICGNGGSAAVKELELWI